MLLSGSEKEVSIHSPETSLVRPLELGLQL